MVSLIDVDLICFRVDCSLRCCDLGRKDMTFYRFELVLVLVCTIDQWVGLGAVGSMPL